MSDRFSQLRDLQIPYLSKYALSLPKPTFVGGLLFKTEEVGGFEAKIASSNMYNRVLQNPEIGLRGKEKMSTSDITSTTNYLKDYGWESVKKQRELEREEMINMPGANNLSGVFRSFSMRGIEDCMTVLDSWDEYEKSLLATTVGNYGSQTDVEATKWNLAGTDVIGRVEHYKEEAFNFIGEEPNKMLISYDVYKAIKNHPKIVDKFVYTQLGIGTTELLSAVFGLDEVIVGKGTYKTDKMATASKYWSNVAILYYDNTSGTPSPILGCHFEKGQPKVTSIYDPIDDIYLTRVNRTWINAMIDVTTGLLGAYLIQTPI